MAAGLAMFEQIQQPGFYAELDRLAKRLMQGFVAAAEKSGIALSYNQVGGMFGFFFSEEKNISNFQQVSRCDGERFKRFYHLMLEQGVYLAPSAFEAGFVSSKHNDALVDKSIAAAEKAFAQL
jgi:glutamate-1-semialdehyde 2,1-aminomutase